MAIASTSGRNRRMSQEARGALAVTFLLAMVLGGCFDTAKSAREKEDAKPARPQRYAALPPKTNLPEFMKGTIYEVADVDNKTPYPVSAYGLVVGLARTGNNTGAPLAVRNYMIEEMVRHGFGSQDPYLRNLKPEMVLQDPRVAIVEVFGFLPVGARRGQRIDVLVQACTGSQTSSLARGMLYQTDLKINGVDPVHPRGGINVYAKARGPVFVNPAFVAGGARSSAARASLRTGVVMNGGIVMQDRPIWLRIRQPQLSTSRAIEARINHRFGEKGVARAQDEGVVYVLVPLKFNGDWEHFMNICTHLYLNAAPGVGAIKAKQLVKEAQKPDAPLADISWCWEAIGDECLDIIRPLYAHREPEIAYAAARAGACIGDAPAEQALLDMARTEGHPFRLAAVRTLGFIPESVRISRMLSELLSSDNALVRIAAYHVLAERGWHLIRSREVRGLFILDRVFCQGPPLVYATRTGTPRIAVFGPDAPLNLPIMFAAMDDKFTISTHNDGRNIVLFDRTSDDVPGGIRLRMPPDLTEMLYRLGGGTDDGFSMCYSDLVGILHLLSEGGHIPHRFILQDAPSLREAVEQAPSIVEVEPEGKPLAPSPEDKLSPDVAGKSSRQ